MKKKITVLFVRKDSIYKELETDCWDIEKDARKWTGGEAAIYHPPCRAWGQLSHFAKPRADEKELAIWSIKQIRKYGGVLEHPRTSRLWDEMKLPKGNEIDEYGGFTLCIDQFWFGHKAKKNTLLYICGISKKEVPDYPLKFEPVMHTVDRPRGNYGKKQITKKEREATPKLLAEWLIKLVKKIENYDK